MTQPIPVAVNGDGNIKVVFVTTLADPTNPTVAECNAVSAVELSCYLTGDGWNPSTDEATVTDDRLCSRQTFEGIGRYTDKLQIKYVYRQQDPDAVDNRAFKTLKRGTIGYLIVRWATAYEPDLAADDVVDVIPIECGVQQKQPRGDNEKLKIMQSLPISSTYQRDVVVVA